MITSPSQFFELQRVHVEALNSVGRALLAGAEKLANLNAAATRSAIDSATEAAQSLSGIKDPKDLVALSGAAAQPSIEKLVGYTRELVGIANGVNAEIGKVVEQQIADSNRRVAELLDYASKNAPAGSEQALALLRGAVAAGNTAFDTVSKVSKQATDWAETNFTAAAKATTTAVSAASSAAAAKAKV
jgi:phasin family protein